MDDHVVAQGAAESEAAVNPNRQFAAKGLRPAIGQQWSVCSEANEVANHMALSTAAPASLLIMAPSSCPPGQCSRKAHKASSELYALFLLRSMFATVVVALLTVSVRLLLF